MLASACDSILCLAYIALNAALNFTNRWALGVHDFSFPMALTSAHMLINPVLLSPFMLYFAAYKGKHLELMKANWRGLAIIAVFNGIQIALNNSSLVHIELSMNQVVRATMPVIVAIIEAFRGSWPPSSHIPVLVAISVGVMLVVSETASRQTELLGVVLVVSSVSLQAGQMSFAGSLLSVKLDSFQMTFYTSPISFLAILLPTMLLEGRRFQGFLLSRTSEAFLVMLVTCILAVIYNVVLFQTIRRLGPVGSAVLGNVKIVVLLLLSRLLMGEMALWTPRHYCGCLLTFGGAAVYSWQKTQKNAIAKKNV